MFWAWGIMKDMYMGNYGTQVDKTMIRCVNQHKEIIIFLMIPSV